MGDKTEPHVEQVARLSTGPLHLRAHWVRYNTESVSAPSEAGREQDPSNRISIESQEWRCSTESDSPRSQREPVGWVLGGGIIIGGLCEGYRVHLRLRRGWRKLRDDRQWLSEFRVMQSIARPRSCLPVAMAGVVSLRSPLCGHF